MKTTPLCITAYKLFFIFLAPLSLLPDMLQAHAADEPGQRVSFAISGGASLGAYEAGINWGLITLMRYETQKDTDNSGERYRPYEVASMTGASAGSINVLLSALTWCARHENNGGFPNRIDNNLFRNVWLSLDINNLLPDKATSPVYQKDDAILSRKDLLAAAELVKKTWNTPVFRKNCRIPLGVTVTRVFPESLRVANIEVKNQRFTVPFELRIKDDSSAGFYFDPDDYNYHSDHSMILLPNEKDKPKYEISDQRIVQAILTSSAFPVAFGRKRLQYCRLKLPNRVNGTLENTAKLQRLQGLSCPDGYEISESEFADGGLFDNLPIGLARTLAENSSQSRGDVLPTAYIYLDPDHLRNKKSKQPSNQTCAKNNAPPSCDEMEYGFKSEIHLLVDAFGTARNYELYRELSSETWTGNVIAIARHFSKLLKDDNDKRSCDESLPYFSAKISCIDALKHAGNLLEASYTRINSPVPQPFSQKKLQEIGVLFTCDAPVQITPEFSDKNCPINYKKFRSDFTHRLYTLATEIKPQDASLLNSAGYSQLSINNDRTLQVTSRGAPIVGKLLGAFAAFLDYKFREYDYYIGVYDSVVLAAQTVCEQRKNLPYQTQNDRDCVNMLAQRFYHALEVDKDESGKYLFALLAKSEFGDTGDFRFAYEPMPQKNSDIDAIRTALEVAHPSKDEENAAPSPVSSAIEFFNTLKQQQFTPTQNDNEPLLAKILEDPDTWAHELTLRFTNRLDYLEQDSSRVIASREPGPQQQSDLWPEILGGSSYALRTATYKYPSFDFSPSTAPEDWMPRYIVPYEVAIDFLEGDVLLTWQPTWSLSKFSNIGIRGSIGIADGLVRSSSEEDDVSENYFTIGVDYTYLTQSGFISSWGITPAYFNLFESPETGKKDSFGGDIHIGFFKNRVRLAIGNKGTGDRNDDWFFLIGLADLPGLIYWFTR